jgi:hypothetical protein
LSILDTLVGSLLLIRDLLIDLSRDLIVGKLDHPDTRLLNVRKSLCVILALALFSGDLLLDLFGDLSIAKLDHGNAALLKIG